MSITGAIAIVRRDFKITATINGNVTPDFFQAPEDRNEGDYSVDDLVEANINSLERDIRHAFAGIEDLDGFEVDAVTTGNLNASGESTLFAVTVSWYSADPVLHPSHPQYIGQEWKVERDWEAHQGSTAATVAERLNGILYTHDERSVSCAIARHAER